MVSGYKITSVIHPLAPSNPLHKKVIHATGLWLSNYRKIPLTLLAPCLGLIGTGLAIRCRIVAPRFAFFCHSISIIAIISTVGVSMFPFILPSSTTPAASLTVWDASSSQESLLLMLAIVAVFVPIVLLYTAWVYHVMRGKITEKDLDDHAY